MLFPKTIFAEKNDINAQLDHLFSEMDEIRHEWIEQECLPRSERNYDHLANELVDIQHSADTALRILQEKYGADAYGAYGRVTVNNTKRGYYGEAECNTQN